MNSKDNIEQFFQKRLQDATPEEGSWNVPSDDLWNKAKVHFPKEEKKKRPFFFFLWGGVVLSVAVITLAVYLFSVKDQTAEKAVENIAVINSELKENLNHTSLTEDKTISSELITSLAPSKSDQPVHNEAAHLNTSNFDKLLTSKNSIQKNRQAKIRSKAIDIKKALDSSSVLSDDKEVSSLALDTNLSQRSESISGIDKKAENKITVPSKNIVLPTPVLFEEISAIKNLPTLLSSVDSDEETFETKTELKLIKPRRSVRKWEIGLSHSPFIINPEWLIELEETDPNESYDFKMRYANINVPISRRLSRRFSLTSGISLAKLDIDFGFETQEIYRVNDTEADLRGLINDSATSGSLAINDESSDVEIIFKPDANLIDGDTLLVRGFVPVNLQIVQFPLLVNYHFGKRKLEGLIHAGVGLDYFYGKITSVDLEAYKDNQLVTEPLIFEPVRESDFDFSLYLGAGMKYHFTDRFNIGLSTKLDFTELLLSRHEIGLYYRF